MAISMSNIQSNTQKNTLEELPVISTTETTETYDATIKLYDSYEKAVHACSIVFLYPGETHTEFYYKIENNKRVYHCVIAIGNFDSHKGHLYLEDFSNGEQSLLKQIADINKQLLKDNANLQNINSKVEEFDAKLLEHQNDIETIFEQLNTLNDKQEGLENQFESVKNQFLALRAEVGDEISGLTSKVNDLGDKITNVSLNIGGQITGLEMKITANINASIHNLEEDLKNYVDSNDISLGNRVNNRISNLESSVYVKIDEVTNQLTNKISQSKETVLEIINSSIDKLETKIEQDIDSKLASAESEITNYVNDQDTLLQNKLTNQIYNNVNRLDASLQELSNDISQKLKDSEDALKVYVGTQTSNLSTNISILNNKLEETENLLDSKIIENTNKIDRINSSINELFAEVSEYINDPSIDTLFDNDIYTVNLCCYTPGGYIMINDEYESNGEYRTYVNGDKITLSAVKNPGYGFKYWYFLDTKLKQDTSVLNLVFNNNDINVIGTIAEEFNPDDKHNNYVAIFDKMYKVTADVSILNFEEAEIDGDKIVVSGPQEYPYFYNKTNISIAGIPIDETHEFMYFSINGQKVYDKQYTINNVQEDLNIVAFFKELRYHVHGEPNVPEWGDVECNTGTIVRYGTVVVFVAVPADGYQFVHWENTTTLEIVGYDQQITVIPTKITGNISLKAVFAEENN